MVHAACRLQAFDDAYQTVRATERLGSVFIDSLD